MFSFNMGLTPVTSEFLHQRVAAYGVLPPFSTWGCSLGEISLLRPIWGYSTVQNFYLIQRGAVGVTTVL